MPNQKKRILEPSKKSGNNVPRRVPTKREKILRLISTKDSDLNGSMLQTKKRYLWAANK